VNRKEQKRGTKGVLTLRGRVGRYPPTLLGRKGFEESSDIKSKEDP